MKKWIIIIAAPLFLITFAFILVYNNAQEPYKKAKTDAVATAKEESAMTTVTDFTVYHSNETYYAVIGQTDKGRQLAVLVPEDQKKKPVTVDLAKGMTKQKAVKKLRNEKKIEKLLFANLGMEKRGPVWELVFLDKNDQLNYYYLLVGSGKWWKKIENI
ncbi:cell wall elongation regulator TseB-like domain-containing protein [Bacillus xiapuensis]|uniref:cell wall elongation regulator TseB-like domain-containing protein n=1 Tax=Bacillus xiapuensis TaxID=2014075 RepID=UPI000C240A5B|nr:DUF5590 domain-containing protein [Bacillus xiapuensis]